MKRNPMRFQKNVMSVRLFTWAMKIGTWLHALPNRLTPPPFRLLQIGSAFWQSRALYVAARLDIANVLGDGVLDAEEIATRVGAEHTATARLLRMLAAMGIFAEVSPRRFRNNRASSFLRTDRPGSMRAMVLMHNSEAMSRPWFEQLERGVREGVAPFRLVHGNDLFSYLESNADADALFSAAMDSVEALAGDSFATDFDWSRFDRVIDVGGSRGIKALAILKRHLGLNALVLDRPQVVAEAERHWATQTAEGTNRMCFQACDILEAVPPARSDKDAYLLSAVLHCFDDATCACILRNLATAIASTGARVIVMEMVLPETGADLAGASFDMQMFMATSGRERTLQEWRSLSEQSGLMLEEVVGLKSFGKLLVLCEKPPCQP